MGEVAARADRTGSSIAEEEIQSCSFQEKVVETWPLSCCLSVASYSLVCVISCCPLEAMCSYYSFVISGIALTPCGYVQILQLCIICTDMHNPLLGHH